MRFMVLVKANRDTEAGVLPTAQELADMGRYNEELAEAGMLLAAEGLQPTAKGARIRFDGDRRTVTDGPFAETGELLAGFWILRAESKEEVVAWVSRAPFKEGEVEIRQVFELEDFPADVLPPEEAERERALRHDLAAGTEG
ncbi:YciI family protein [Kitasatospora sp. NPDC002040]|uniref:YciI family protein n=1 Tax=Kitasatospora sp. NPDC002040 TaxID=3154661 RepID=UPI003316CD23